MLAPNKAVASQAQAALQPIHCILDGENSAKAQGRAASGVIILCRKLIAAGHDLRTPLCAYRNGILALVASSIGEAATLRVGRVGFVARPRIPAGSAPARQGAPTASVNKGGLRNEHQ